MKKVIVSLMAVIVPLVVCAEVLVDYSDGRSPAIGPAKIETSGTNTVLTVGTVSAPTISGVTTLGVTTVNATTVGASGTITGNVVNAGTTMSAGTTLRSGTTLTVGTSATVGTTLGVTGLATLNDLTVNTNATITGIATFNGSIKIGTQTGWTGIVTNHGNGITNLMWIGKGVVTNVTYIP